MAWSPDIDRLIDFDEAEWAEVERTFAGRLLAYVARRVPDADAQRDVVQEIFLGAVRGIARFDRRYSFEQYIFGICRNRTIDAMRRRGSGAVGEGGDDEAEGMPPLDAAVDPGPTPSGIFRQVDLEERGRSLIAEALRSLVQETWAAEEYERLMVIEALLLGGMRNRDVWRRFGLRDETAVAGIKFRALGKLRDHVARSAATAGEGESVVASLAQLAADGEVPIDIATVWRTERVSCPARHWLARFQEGDERLDPGARAFIEFHVHELGCEFCQANLDDLSRRDDEALAELLEAVRASSLQLLRSRRGN